MTSGFFGESLTFRRPSGAGFVLDATPVVDTTG
jgi:hypothetical protein